MNRDQTERYQFLVISVVLFFTAGYLAWQLFLR